MLVSSPRIVTFALETTAPLVSRAVPMIAPYSNWPYSGAAAIAAQRQEQYRQWFHAWCSSLSTGWSPQDLGRGRLSGGSFGGVRNGYKVAFQSLGTPDQHSGLCGRMYYGSNRGKVPCRKAFTRRYGKDLREAVCIRHALNRS